MSLPQSVANELSRQVARNASARVSQPMPPDGPADEESEGVYTRIETSGSPPSAYRAAIRFMEYREKPRSVEDELRHVVPDDEHQKRW